MRTNNISSMTITKSFVSSLYLGGCLLLLTAPLLLGLYLAIQGTPYFRCIVTPVEATWSFNPFVNLWPAALTGGVLMALGFTLSNNQRGRGCLNAVQTILQGFVGGTVLAAIVLSSSTAIGAWFNARWDGSAATRHPVQVIDQVVQWEKFGRTSYLVVTDWRVPDGGAVLVCAGDDQSGRQLSQETRAGAWVYVSTRPGFLGLEWVVGVEPDGAGP